MILADRSRGPLILASLGICSLYASYLSSSLDAQSPLSSNDTARLAQPISLNQVELDRLRGWYGLEVNGGPLQYHLTLRPLMGAIKLGCLKSLKRGDLIQLTIHEAHCEVSAKRLSGEALYALQIPLPLNEAPLEALTQIKGIGLKRARLIVAGRPWRSVRSLRRLRGIGEKTLLRLTPYLTIEPSPTLWPSKSHLSEEVGLNAPENSSLSPLKRGRGEGKL